MEQNVPLEEEVDSDDAAALHYIVKEGRRGVGTARLVLKGAGVGKIGRLAVLPEYRRLGIGSALIHHIRSTDGAHLTELILDAQVAAQRFYERLGFRAEGSIFLDAGIPHVRMRLGGDHQRD